MTLLWINEIADLIKARRSIRLFKSDPVSMELLVDLLNIAAWAPNHGVREPWRFILYKDEARETLATAMVGTYSAEEKDKYAKSKSAYLMQVPLHLIVVLSALNIMPPSKPKCLCPAYFSIILWIHSALSR